MTKRKTTISAKRKVTPEERAEHRLLVAHPARKAKGEPITDAERASAVAAFLKGGGKVTKVVTTGGKELLQKFESGVPQNWDDLA